MINTNQECYIIAELSANHGSSIEVALQSVRAAKRAGANAIKLQTYRGNTITLDCHNDDFLISGTLWDGKYLYELYEEAHLPWEWHKPIFDEARKIGIDCFSSPFDFTAVDYLEQFDPPAYKIASFEITDTPLIKYVAAKGRTIIISTGIAEYADIKLAVDTCRAAGNNDIILLKCTSAYPAPVEDANLAMMRRFAVDFGVRVGLSDHTLGITVPVVSVALGASVIEKHFILDRSVGGPDASFSLDETEFAEMVSAIRQAEKAVGNENYDLTEKQKSGKTFARSLYVAKDILAGELITHDNIRSVRPGHGLHPKYLDDFIGKISLKGIKKGERLSWDVIEYNEKA